MEISNNERHKFTIKAEAQSLGGVLTALRKQLRFERVNMQRGQQDRVDPCGNWANAEIYISRVANRFKPRKKKNVGE